MKYIRELASLFEKQHLTIAGDHKGRHILMTTDRKLTIIEDHGEVGEQEPVAPAYIPSFKHGTVDPQVISIALDRNKHPVLPEGAEVVTAAEESAESGRALLSPPEAIELVMGLIAGMYTFELPTALHTLKDTWLAFRIVGGILRIRSADEYQALNDTAEYEMATLDNVPNLEFAIPVEILRVCHDLADSKVVFAVKQKGAATYVSIRTPDCIILYFTKPLKLEEATVAPLTADHTEEIPDTPENQTESDNTEQPSPACIACSGSGEKGNGDACVPCGGTGFQKGTQEYDDVKKQEAQDAEAQQQEVEVPTEEPAAAEAPEEQSAEEPLEQPDEEPGEVPDDSDGSHGSERSLEPVEVAERDAAIKAAEAPEDCAEPQPIIPDECFAELGRIVASANVDLEAGDVDPLNVLDVYFPEIIKLQAAVNDKCKTTLRNLNKNVAKQCRKALKSKADPAELTELRKKVSQADARAATAERELADIKKNLSGLKGLL